MSTRSSRHEASRRRAAVLGVLAAAATTAVSAVLAGTAAHDWRVLARAAAAPPGTPGSRPAGVALPVEATLGVVLTGAAALGCAWLALLLLAGAVQVLPPARGKAARRLAGALLPRWGPRAAALLLAVAAGASSSAATGPPPEAGAVVLAVGDPVMAALGDPAGAGESGAVGPTGTGDDDLPVPDWAPTPAPCRPGAGQSQLSRGGGPEDRVTVRRGDSLWSIAQRHLGPEATVAEVATEWPRWYAANRQVVGPDPDLLLPGQLLRPPEGSAPRGDGR